MRQYIINVIGLMSELVKGRLTVHCMHIQCLVWILAMVGGALGGITCLKPMLNDRDT